MPRRHEVDGCVTPYYAVTLIQMDIETNECSNFLLEQTSSCSMRTSQDTAYIQSLVRVPLLPCGKPRAESGYMWFPQLLGRYPNAHLSHRNDNCSNHDHQGHPVVSLILPAHSPDMFHHTENNLSRSSKLSAIMSCHFIHDGGVVQQRVAPAHGPCRFRDELLRNRVVTGRTGLESPCSQRPAMVVKWPNINLACFRLPTNRTARGPGREKTYRRMEAEPTNPNPETCTFFFTTEKGSEEKGKI